MLYDNLQERQSNGDEIDMSELEILFREAALATGRLALSRFLSNVPERIPQCPKCNEPMRNLGKRGKQIMTLLGECKFDRNYYGCDCADNYVVDGKASQHEYAVPKDVKLGISGTKFTETVKRVTAQIAASDSFKGYHRFSAGCLEDMGVIRRESQ